MKLRKAGGPARYHGALDATFEAVRVDDAGRFRIRGVASTLGIMRSKRVFLPSAFDKQLRAGKVDVPLMLNHGMVEGLGSIGRVDRLELRQGAGLAFEAWIASGTRNADEARKLAEQGVLRTVSLGWLSRSDRYIGRNDPDLPKSLADMMDAEGVRAVHAFSDVEVIELSLVDVPDDPGARLAARAAGGGVEQALRRLAERVDALEARIANLALAGGHADVAGLCAGISELLDARLLQLKAYVAEIAAETADGHDRESAIGAMVADATGGDLAELSGLVARVGGKLE